MSKACASALHTARRLRGTACAAAILLALTGCAGLFGGSDRPSYSSGGYKVGNPYVVNGRLYTPVEDFDYEAVGTASWYGSEFHGRRTSNGEVFDRTKLTAAHPTLQLPSVIRVTNLENGRVADLRVNDRGPFTKNRLIDVSERAAEVLGFRQKGSARVRVQVLEAESRALKSRSMRADNAADGPNGPQLASDGSLMLPPELAQSVMSAGGSTDSYFDAPESTVLSNAHAGGNPHRQPSLLSAQDRTPRDPNVFDPVADAYHRAQPIYPPMGAATSAPVQHFSDQSEGANGYTQMSRAPQTATPAPVQMTPIYMPDAGKRPVVSDPYQYPATGAPSAPAERWSTPPQRVAVPVTRTDSGGELPAGIGGDPWSGPQDSRFDNQGAAVSPLQGAEALPAPTAGDRIAAGPATGEGVPAEASAASWPGLDSGEPLFVQAGAFVAVERAESSMTRLSALGPTEIVPVEINGLVFHRVRVGPAPDGVAAMDLLGRVQAEGFPDARIVAGSSLPGRHGN